MKYFVFRIAKSNIYIAIFILMCCFITEGFHVLVSEYNLKLIDKKLLQKKLKEYIKLAGTTEEWVY